MIVTMDNQMAESIISNLRSSSMENKLNALRRINEKDIERFKDEIIALFTDPAEDIRWLAVDLLCRAGLKGKDLTLFLKPLRSLFADPQPSSWFPKGYTVGHLAVTVTVYHWMNTGAWETIIELLQTETAHIPAILGCFRTSYGKKEITPVIPLLDTYRRDQSPEIRGMAVASLVGYHYWEAKFAEIENFLKNEDYATCWYALSTLDNIAESGGDVTPLLPVLISFFEHSNAELEINRNVKYTATLRELAAGVLIWHLIAKKSFRNAKSLIIHGVDLMQVPEIKTIQKEFRSYSRNPDK